MKLPDLNNLNSTNPKIKYGTAKELLHIAAEQPTALYPYYDRWIELMSGSNNILRWTAIDIIGQLSRADADNRTEKQMKTLISFLKGGKLITTNHAIFALGVIAKNKPKLRAKIIKELLAISGYKFETNECRAIVTGKVLEVLRDFLPQISKDEEALKFIRNAQRSQRNATRKKAIILEKQAIKGVQ